MKDRKIVNLSLHRSATDSFSQFMRDHGFRAAHWPGIEFDSLCEPAVAGLDTKQVFQRAKAIIESHDVFADIPFCFLAAEFLQSYPDAQFLMIIRDVHSWLLSVRQHIGMNELVNLDKIQYWLNCTDHKKFLLEYDDQELRDIYMKHLMRVVNIMQDARAHFRLFSLNDKSINQTELANELGKYLKFEVRTPFPAINVGAHRLS
jgi:hypothetical protein